MLALLGAVSTSAGADRLDADRFKNGTAVRAAFRDVVAAARHSTVQVFCNDRPAVLGTIIDASGYVLTKASELSGSVRCRLADGRELKSVLVAAHRGFDLALLRLDADDLPAIEWKADSKWRVGQWLATPGLDELPVAVGILSAPPLAIPPLRGVLGISVSDTDGQTRVSDVSPNSGAHKAGIDAGDVILSVDGRTVTHRAVLERYLAECAPGDVLKLRVLRSGQELDLAATLREPFSNLIERSHLQNRLGGRLSRRRAGFARALQHDSVVQPDECGGPIIDLSGKAVGINIARAGRTETLAIPASIVLPLLGDLKSQAAQADRPGKESAAVSAEETPEDDALTTQDGIPQSQAPP